MDFAFIDVRSSAGWEEWTHDGSDVVDGGVVLAKAAPTYVSSARLTPPWLEAVDIDFGICGDLYVLGSNGEIYKHDRESNATERLPWVRREDDRLGEPRAICVTARTVFVADGADGSVRAVSKDRLETVWRDTDSFEDPIGIEADRDGKSVYVADGGTGPGRGFLVSVASVGGDWDVTRVVEGLTFPRDITFPGDIVADDAGTLYVLHHPDDGSDASGNGAEVLRFDRDRLTGTDRPALEDAVLISSRFPDAAAAFEVRDTNERFTPSCIEVLPPRSGSTAGSPEQDAESESEAVEDEGDENGKTELIAAVGPEGAEWALFRYSSSKAGFEKLPSFRRSCSDLLFQRRGPSGGDGGLYVIEGRSKEVHFLEERSRNRRRGDGTEGRGAYTATVTKTFDSGSPGTEWHRVKLGLRFEGDETDGRPSSGSAPDVPVPDVPDARSRERTSGRDTQVYVSYRAADDPDRDSGGEGVSSNGQWRRITEPDPRDALLRSAEGRYLRVRLTLVGSESSSPRVESFRAYFPRRSYLRYLPAIYEEDERSADFLERFLAVFESVFVDIEAEIAGVTQYFDPAGIPAGPNDDYLSWLSGWLAVETDETWPEPAKRAFLSKAPELFKKRGTREGLLETLRIYLDHIDVPDRPRLPEDDRRGARGGDRGPIDRSGGERVPTAETEDERGEERDGRRGRLYLLEHPDLDCLDCPPGEDTIGRSNARDRPSEGGPDRADRTDAEDAGTLFGRILDRPQSFLVLVRPPVSDERMETIRRIVESEKPAHTVGRAVELRPWMRLGSHSYLGVNSALARREFALGASGLGEDAVLTADTASSPPANRTPGEDSFIS